MTKPPTIAVGVEIAKLVPTNARQQRQFGYDAGKFVVPEDFDEELPDPADG
jgi:hypothetical protein